MTTLTYEFNNEPFEYKANEIKYFDSFSNNKLIELAKENWQNMDAEEQGKILSELESDEIAESGEPIWNKLLAPNADKEWFYEMFLYDLIDEDELEDYFQAEAYKAYKEGRENTSLSDIERDAYEQSRA